MLDKITLSKELKNPNFLGSHDLFTTVDNNGNPEYRTQVLTIKDITREQITDMENIKKDAKATKEAYILHFAEAGYKPYVISAKVVIEAIEKATGTKVINNWVGKKIKFYVEKNVKAFGKVTDALRVTTTPIAEEKINCEVCGKPTDAGIWKQMKAGIGAGVCSAECKHKHKESTEVATNE